MILIPGGTVPLLGLAVRHVRDPPPKGILHRSERGIALLDDLAARVVGEIHNRQIEFMGITLHGIELW